MKALIQKLKSKASISTIEVQRDNLIFINCDAEHMIDVLTWLRDLESYNHLVMISAVDFIEEGEFQLTYLLHHYQNHSDIGLRVRVSREQSVADSIHHLWPTAHVYQRELKEMFGIDFPGSPRLNEPMMLEGWDQIPPMRKEFDTKQYSEDTFFPRPGRQTSDPKQHMEEKVYPLEAQIKEEIKQRVRKNRNQ